MSTFFKFIEGLCLTYLESCDDKGLVESLSIVLLFYSVLGISIVELIGLEDIC